MAFLATPYGAFVSSGYPLQMSSSRKGIEQNLGYAHAVPVCTNFSI